jgi:glutathione S-transferase
VQTALKPYNTQLFQGMLGELQALVHAAAAKGQPWLSGQHLGPLDAYTLTFARWGTMAGIAPQEHPALWDFVQRVAAEPAVARVIERERLQLNMAKPA